MMSSKKKTTFINYEEKLRIGKNRKTLKEIFTRVTPKLVVDIASDLILSSFSEIVYENGITNIERQLSGSIDDDLKEWKVLTWAENPKDKYFGVAFWNEKCNQVVIAHRGTAFGSLSFKIYQCSSQIHSACTFAAFVLKEIDRNKINISFTGHSLGGWLAQITTFTSEYLELTHKEFRWKKEKIDVRQTIHTLVFDSPGCSDILYKISNFYWSKHKTKPCSLISELDITVYFSSPNIFKHSGLHTGVANLFNISKESDNDPDDLSRYGIKKIVELLKREVKFLRFNNSSLLGPPKSNRIRSHEILQVSKTFVKNLIFSKTWEEYPIEYVTDQTSYYLYSLQYYLKTIPNYDDISFEKTSQLKTFLSSTDAILCLITNEDTRHETSRIRKNLQELNSDKKKIFLNLTKLSLLRRIENEQVFEPKFHQIVIECDVDQDCDNVHKDTIKFLIVTCFKKTNAERSVPKREFPPLSNENKNQLILILPDTDFKKKVESLLDILKLESAITIGKKQTFGQTKEEKQEEFSFTFLDLTFDSRKKLLEKEIFTMHGQIFSLENLLCTHSLKPGETTEKAVKLLSNLSILTHLLHKSIPTELCSESVLECSKVEFLEVQHKFKFGYNKFIMFLHQNKENATTGKNISYFLTIINENDLKKKEVQKIKDIACEIDNKIPKIRLKVINSRENNEKQFYDFCFENKRDRIYWFLISPNDLDSVKLQQIFDPDFYICRRFYSKNKKSEIFDESDIVKKYFQDGIVIAEDAGMGKSTTSLRFAKSLTDSWVIWVNLIDFRNNETDIPSIINSTTVARFLARTYIKTDPIVESLLKLFLEHRDMKISIVIFFDGFDRILNEGARNNLLGVFRYLKEETSAKIWITTRTWAESILEKGLFKTASSKTAWKMTEINIAEQIEYFHKCSPRPALISVSDEQNQQNLEITQILKNIQDLEVPLYLRMAGEIFQPHLKQPFNIDVHELIFCEEPLLTIQKLYDAFIDLKINSYIKEKFEDADDYERKYFFKIHRCLAFQSLFPDRITFLDYDEKIDIYDENKKEEIEQFSQIGLVKVSNSGNFHFTHESIAEFLAADLMITHLLPKIHGDWSNPTLENFIFGEILMKKEFQLIRQRIDYQLRNIEIENFFKKRILEFLKGKNESYVNEFKQEISKIYESENLKNIKKILEDVFRQYFSDDLSSKLETSLKNIKSYSHKNLPDVTIDEAWNEKQYDKVLALLMSDSNFPDQFTLTDLNENDEIQRQIISFTQQGHHLHELIKKEDFNGVKEFTANNQSKRYLNSNNESAEFTAIVCKNFRVYAYLKSIGVGFNKPKTENELEKLNEAEKNELREIMLSYFPQTYQAHIFYIISKLKLKFPPENAIALYEEKMVDFLNTLNAISEISTILKVIQYAPNLEIVLDFDKNDLTDICLIRSESESAVGQTLYEERTIYIAAGSKRGDYAVLGTIAHELTHLAMEMIFQNNGNPYHKSKDALKRQEFEMLTNKIEKKQTTFAGPPTHTLLKAFTCYDPLSHHSEVIVRVSQILAQYPDGRQWLEKNVPDLFKYYKDYVINKKCQEFLGNAYLLKPRSIIRSMNECLGEIINLKKHHVFFKDVSKISKFLSEEKKKIFIFSSTNTWMGLLKILQGLFDTNYLTTYDHFLVLKLDIAIKEFDNVKKAFESEATNTLIIECPLEIHKKTSLSDINRLISLINRIDKKIVFVLNKGEADIYSGLIKSCGFIDTCTQEKDEEYTLYDLDDPSRSQILGKEIIFQGSKTNLYDVIGNDQYLQELIDVETIGKLIHDQKIALGGNLLRTSNLEGAFADIAQEVNMDIFADKLVNSKDCFVISNIGGTNKKNELEKYLKRDLDASIIFEGDNYYARDIGDKKIFLPDVDDKFKDFCHDNPEKKIHLLNVKHDEDGTKFFLKQTYDPDCYIERKFKNSFVIDTAKLNQMSKDSSETVLISSDNLINKHVINDHPKIKWLDLENAEIEFKRLTSYGQTVHKLQLEGDFLVWKESYGSIKKLREWIAKDSRKNHFIEEKDLITQIANKKAVIIADNPGMGMSTSITKLYDTKYDKETKCLAHCHWIIRVNLKNHLEAIRDLKFDQIKMEDVVNFLSKVDPTLNDAINKNLLLFALDKEKFSKPLLMVFDGFDELLDREDRTTIISLLKYLKNDTMCKVWITTRLHHYKEILEDELATFAVAFEPLNNESKKEFITKYFKNRLNLILSRNEFENFFKTQKIEVYSDCLLEKIKSIFKDDVSSFIEAPQQLNLMLEGSEKYFCCLIDKIDLDYLGSDILKVYENFLNRKYEIYFRKTELKGELRKEVDRKFINDYHKDLAEAQIKNTKPERHWENVEDLILSVGLLKPRNEGFEFVHFTFREYFAALVFIDYITTEKVPSKQLVSLHYLVNEILLKEDYRLIRKFINKHLERMDIKIVPENNLSHLGEMMASSYNQKREKSVLQVATEEDNEYLLEFLIFCTEYCYTHETKNLGIEILWREILQHGKDSNLLISAAKKGSNKAFITLIDFMRKLPPEEQYKILYNGVHHGVGDDDDAPLHSAAELGHTQIVTCIFKKAVEIASEDEQFRLICKRNHRGKTALSLATENDQLDVIHQIFKEAKNMSKEKQSAMLLMTIPDRDCRTTIQFLAAEKDFKTFRLILENACEILPSKELRDFLRLNEIQFIKKSEEFLRLHGKSFSTDFEKELQVLERYWERKEDTDKYKRLGSPYKFFDRCTEDEERQISERFALWNKAIEKENSEMIGLILEKVAKVANPNELYEMLCHPKYLYAFHFASKKGQHELIKLLLAKMNEISTREQQFELFCFKTDGVNTILHLALINGHYKIVELILQKLGELLSEETKNFKSSKDVLEETSLLVEVAHGKKESVLLVLEKAEKILSQKKLFGFLTAKENIEETPLHLTVIRKDVEIVRILLKKADELLPSEKWCEFVAMENGKGESAFHIASALDSGEIIKLFLDIAEEKPERVFKFIYMKDKDEKTALHIASEKGRIETVKHLLKSVEKFSPEQVFELFSMTSKYHKRTSFHLAAEKGHDEILMCLLNTVQQIIPEKTFTLLCIKDKYHETAFEKCVKYCQKETIASILKMASSEINNLEFLKILYRDDETILHKATKNRRDEIVKMLFQTVKTLPPEVIFELLCTENRFQETVFHTASRYCSDETVKLLLEHTKSLSLQQTFHLLTIKAREYNTILFQAVENFQHEAVKLLLQNATKLAPDQKFNFLSMKYISALGETIFHTACEKNRHKILKLLLEILKTLPLKEAFDVLFIKWVDLSSRTPLHYACSRQQDEAALLLLEFAENLSLEKTFEWSCMKDELHRTALHTVCQYKHDKIVKSLLESAKKLSSEKPFELLSIPDKDGKTALCIASHVDHTKIVKLLLEYAEKMPEEKFSRFLSMKDSFGDTALHVAAESGRDETLKILLQFTEKVSPENAFKLLCNPNRNQESVLHITSKNCHTETVKFLLEIAEKLSAEKVSSLLLMQNKWLKTALHNAINGYRESNVKFLLDKAEEISPEEAKKLLLTTDNCRRTALHQAASKGLLNTVKLILETSSRLKIYELLTNEKDEENKTARDLAYSFGVKHLLTKKE